MVIPLRCLCGIEFSFCGFAAFGDKVVAGLTAEEGNGEVFGVIVGNSVETRGFTIVEMSIGVEFPEDFFGAIVGWAANFLDEFLGASIADGSGIAIHAGLSAEFVAKVFDG